MIKKTKKNTTEYISCGFQMLFVMSHSRDQCWLSYRSATSTLMAFSFRVRSLFSSTMNLCSDVQSWAKTWLQVCGISLLYCLLLNVTTVSWTTVHLAGMYRKKWVTLMLWWSFLIGKTWNLHRLTRINIAEKVQHPVTQVVLGDLQLGCSKQFWGC